MQVAKGVPLMVVALMAFSTYKTSNELTWSSASDVCPDASRQSRHAQVHRSDQRRNLQVGLRQFGS